MNPFRHLQHCFLALASLLALALSFSASASVSVDDLLIMTENYPPYNFKQAGRLQGIGVDLMVAILEKMGSKQRREDIRFVPWARGYELLLRKPGTCLFSTTRTPQREKRFKWVGPISPTTVSLIARSDRKIKIDSIADLKKYKIGAVIQDVGEQLLLSEGLKLRDIDRIGGTNVTLLSIKKLNRGRIDLWAYEENVAKWEIRRNGFNPEDYETVYVLNQGQLYYAFHKDTPDALIEDMQRALDQIKQEGRYQEILDPYLK